MKILVPPKPADELDDIASELVDYAKILRSGTKVQYIYPALYETRARLSKLVRDLK